ncbi:MAG: FHA domain-containing protein [Rhodobacteraceae bacterium PARR1]|nr:MAG: FHA domain-containing protein [Rhodobacteraceae bacterium PARR1]
MTHLSAIPGRWARAALLVLCAGILSAHAAGAETQTRSPATGIAVLDCAPAMPALADMCSLRIPARQARLDMHKSSDNDGAEFKFIRDNDPDFPKGIHLSATMILIDETPGPKGARLPSLPLERSLIAQLVDALPEGELIAVYGFNEAGSLHPLADYTTSKQLARTAVSDMKTAGINTHIATNLRDAIKIFGERDDILFRNIIVVTDGEEEGIDAEKDVLEQSVEAGVVVSSLGLFWRPEGTANVGRAKDYLGSRLTTRDFGVFESVPLTNAKTAAERVASFAARYSRSIEQSGLIVPDGPPAASDLVVETEAPVVGDPDKTETITHQVRYTPKAPPPPAPTEAAAEPAPEPAAEATPDPDLIYGYPRLWFIYGGAGLVGLLILGMILWAITRNRKADEIDDLDLSGGIVDSAPLDGPPIPLQPVAGAAPARPMVALVREDTRERLILTIPGGTIGRAPNNALSFLDDGVSRVHAGIRLVGGAVTLADEGSLNGTFLNGKAVKAPARLKSGDKIGLGNVTLHVTLL